MNRRLSKIKAMLVGFMLIKVAVAVAYFTGTLTLPEILFAQRAAVAQDAVSPQEPTVSGDMDAIEDGGADGGNNSGAAEKEKQYAEVQALMNQLEIKRLKLKDEEERLRQERAQLEKLKRDIDMELDELAAVRAQIDAALARQAEMATQEQQAQNAAEAAKLKRLVKVYTSMSPKQAAKIVDKLDMQVVYDVFSNMKGEQVGQILTYVSEERAAEITERLAADGAQ
jgi:flagellar motility protein MotE (MotC chaperone)